MSTLDRPEPPSSDLQEYIKACASSFSRGRIIVIVLITASVLTFVTTWNSRPPGWTTSRIALASRALMLFPSIGDTRQTITQQCPGNPTIMLRILSMEDSGLSED